jgi:uncharacterized repeat protein (TIGR03803 family)
MKASDFSHHVLGICVLPHMKVKDPSRGEAFKMRRLLANWFIIVVSCALLAACGGGVFSLTPRGGGSTSGALSPAAGTITVTPSKLSLFTAGSAWVVVAEAGYTGEFTSASKGARACPTNAPYVALWSPSRGKGPRLPVNVTAPYAKQNKAPASCAITFSDAKKHTATLSVTIERNTYKQLYRFQGGSNGAVPLRSGDLVELHGMLYGTTFAGGDAEACPSRIFEYTPGCGTVFEVNPSTGAARVIYRFKSMPDGAVPWAGAAALNDKLYGTTWLGGKNHGCYNGAGCGTAFEVDPTTGKERVIYAFGSIPDAQNPQAGMIAVNGVLYGTAGSGGNASGDGAVFKLTPSGSGFTESVLYAFKGSRDGLSPAAGLLAVNGMLYGTTQAGGTAKCFKSSGCGTVFEVNMHTGAERVLHRFNGIPDGESPTGSLIAVNGALYGTTQFGGSEKCPHYVGSFPPDAGCGTVFEVNPSSGTERVVYSFKGNQNRGGNPSDGAQPLAGLTALNGALYGTGSNGGAAHFGGIFKLTPLRSGYTESVLYNFEWSGGNHTGSDDGSLANAGLTDVKGTLFGATITGGALKACINPHHGDVGCGTVFAITP